MAINISDNNPRVNYTATSGQTVFTVPFEFFASTDLTVYVDGSVLAVSDYTVTGGSGSTGSITTDSGQTTGAKIAIVRDVPLERTTDLTSTYSASSLNDQLDRIVTQIADLDDRVSRSISLNDYEVGVSLDLPATATRLGKTIQFNSSTGALEIGPSGNELTSIASIASEITALDGIKTNITTVASAITNVNSVGSNISSVTSVASSISNVNTVNTNIANVNSVAGSISDLNDVADSLDQVELVGGSISNVDIVGPAIANVNTVAGDISNINTVAGISANITTIAGITADISTVNSNSANINLVATNIDDVNDVANVITKVTTVADNIANVNTVAPSVSYLSTVANNIANINTLAPISADITTVAGVASSVGDAAANAAAAEAAKVAAEAAQAAAELAADNFDDTYLGAKSSDPTADNDGDALTAGDLYFSTTDNNLKVYTGSAWQAAALDASGFVDVTGDSMTGNLLFGDGDAVRFGTHGDLTIEHDLNNSNITGSNNRPLNITTNGTLNINSDNIYFREHAASNTYIEMRDGGGYDHAVRIFHSGTNVRLETTSTGIDVTGTVTADGLTVEDADGATIRIQSSDTSVDGGSLGQLEFYSNDASTGGTGVKGKIQVTDTSSFGTAYEMNFFTGYVTGGAHAETKKMSIGPFGDISFYEDTGTTAKLTWDASAEMLTTSGLTVESTATTRPTIGNSDVNTSGLTTGLNFKPISNLSDGAKLNIISGFQPTVTSAYTAGFEFVTQDHAGGGSFAQTKALSIGASGDISFYEDTGTTAKFFWDASAESLGIGVSSISNVIGANYSQLEVGGSTSGILDITSGANLGIRMSSDGNLPTIAARTQGWPLRFSTTPTGGSVTERMRIDSIGDLTVKGGRIFVNESDNGNIAIGLTRDADEGYVQVYSAGSITSSIRGNGDSYFNGGNVLIGTTSVGSSLDGLAVAGSNQAVSSRGNIYVYTTDSQAADKGGQITFGGSYTGTTETIWAAVAGRKENGTDTNTSGYLQFSTRASGGIEEAMRIDSSGNVGIGVSPNSGWATGTGSRQALQIGFGSIAGRINDLNTEISNNAYAVTTGTNPTWAGMTRHYKQQIELDNSGNIKFNLAPTVDQSTFDSSPNFTWTEAMTLDSSGNLLVGKATGGVAIDGFQANAAGYATITDTSFSPLILNRKTSDGTIIDLRKDGSTVGSIGTGSGLLTIGESGQNQLAVDYDTGSAINGVRLQNSGASGGGIIIANNGAVIGPRTDDFIDLGNANQRFKDLYLSGGVYLGGTVAANYLDDYELGYFSPTIIRSSSNPTVTYTTASTFNGFGTNFRGRYVVIGTKVFCEVDIRFSAITGGSGSYGIGNLPFTATSGYSGGVVTEHTSGITYSSYSTLNFEVQSSGAVANLIVSGSGINSAILSSISDHNGYIIGSFSYTIA